MNNETPEANDPKPINVTDNRPASLRENTTKRNYHTQERIEMLMEIARNPKHPDRFKALELMEAMRRDVRKTYAQRQDRAAARADEPEPPTDQTMTEEQKGVLGF